MLQLSTKLYQKLQKQYSRHINLDLKRIRKVLEKLNNPEEQLGNVVNVIGSDGKNSFLTSLKYFLEANGEKVNAFTSPHLFDVRHRFWLGNKFISLKEIKKYKKIIEHAKQRLTLFELLTCIYILAATKTDFDSYNLCESGLLFKKDSTNLWSNPLAQVVTNINFQHQEWVRPRTMTEICRQKVGYLSDDTTIYIGKQKAKTLKIIKSILKNNSSNQIIYGSWKIINKNKKKYYKDKKNLIKLNSKRIHSDGLWENVGLAIKVALDFGVNPKVIKKTVPNIQFEGRVQFVRGKLTKILKKNEKLLLDGCHSDEGTKNLAQYLRKFKTPIYGICGIQKNKNPNQLIKNFKGVLKKIVTVKIPNEPSAMSPVDLRRIAEKNNFKSIESKNIKDALKKISTKEKKIIVIFGSLYLVGNALSMN
jgi:dihydrofolate synthase/folylpolyglutamate synthase